ncbi:sulfurtransferase-like selenium metabolism protein YedF [Planctomycetota bacterium]
MADVVDVRGKPCPQPVIETRAALAAVGSGCVEVLVDNAASAENVARMARTMGWDGQAEDSGDGSLRLTLTRAGEGQDAQEQSEEPGVALAVTDARPPRVVVSIGSEHMGTGDDELGAILIKAFVETLQMAVPRPSTLVFYNAGVKLAVGGSPLLDDLRLLAESGAEVLVCGTCLRFFGIEDRLGVGVVSNMYEILGALAGADRVVKP